LELQPPLAQWFASRRPAGFRDGEAKEKFLMNRNRLLMGVSFALIVALLTSMFVYREFKQASAAPGAATQMIVVAAQPMELGTRLDPSKLKLVPWPAGQPMEGMFTSVAECTNRALVTSVAENEPILKAKLASADSGAGLSATIPEGMRAISVAVNDVIGVAGFVTPGTMVDILVTGQSVGGSNGSLDITRTILENIRVLAAGQKIEQDRDGKPQTVSVITVLVNPEDAAKLTMASTQGKIQLALRNTVDTKATNPPAVLQSNLFATASQEAPPKPVVVSSAPRKVAPAPAAPALPPPPYTVEVITGDKRETKNFPNQ
jgi:pilus assembly protein CpaB